MGSGTTAMVAKSLNRYYLGCELNEDYRELIDHRVPVTEVAPNPLEKVMFGI